MITCTVHEPPHAPGDRLDRADSLVFVRDGFSWVAAAFTPFWAIAHRLWLVLLGYVVVLAGLELGLRAVGLHTNGAATVLMAALHLLIGLEASSLRRWTLGRRGYAVLGSVSGRNLDDCERRFFDAWLPSVPVIRPSALTGGGGAPSIGGIEATRPMPISERPRTGERRGGFLGGWTSRRPA